jgi:uncharacterized membrane protein YjgN (DUF898 family)
MLKDSVFQFPFYNIICVGHFRNILYDFTAITKYKMITLLTFLKVYTHVLCSMLSPALSTHFSHYVVNDQLQFCIHPCSNNEKLQ